MVRYGTWLTWLFGRAVHQPTPAFDGDAATIVHLVTTTLTRAGIDRTPITLKT